jgi:cystathionine beta-lyase/cystathionine gamma-synthase
MNLVAVSSNESLETSYDGTLSSLFCLKFLQAQWLNKEFEKCLPAASLGDVNTAICGYMQTSSPRREVSWQH